MCSKSPLPSSPNAATTRRSARNPRSRSSGSPNFLPSRPSDRHRMSSALDMSLDDLIKNNKKSAGGNSRGRGRSSGGAGPSRRIHNRHDNRPAPYSMGKAPETAWQHDLFSPDQPAGFDGGAPGSTSIELGTKLYISNLDYGVSNEDVKELFAEVGDIKRHSIHYDRSGRSKGTAEVVFSRREDAMAAVKRYNNVQLDGKPMKIEIVGTNIMTPQVAAVNGAFVNRNGTSRSVLGRPGGASSYSRGGDRGGGRGGGRRGGRRGGRLEPPSAESLDADLDKYHLEAMQTN